MNASTPAFSPVAPADPAEVSTSAPDTDWSLRVTDDPADVDAAAWDALLAVSDAPTPFLRHAYLKALQDSGSATPETGWHPRWITLHQGTHLMAACVLYLKTHSYGEYVFDWAWARAYQQHGLPYYPKGVVAVPFTPVPGSRLLARNEIAREALLDAVLELAREWRLSSLHLLFLSEDDRDACTKAGLMPRDDVQFHWLNNRPGADAGPYADFDDFLAQLTQAKRKNIRQERRKVRDAGVRFRWARGAGITAADWDFFYRCYAQTYAEHGNPPYLSVDFFRQTAQTQPGLWLLFVAERDGEPIAASLMALGESDQGLVVYGRYWGALARVDALHFDACYYQPIDWAIAHGARRFEGGAQGEHKLARALLPTPTHSAHWVAHPQFAQAIARALAHEQTSVQAYGDWLGTRTPFKRSD